MNITNLVRLLAIDVALVAFYMVVAGVLIGLFLGFENISWVGCFFGAVLARCVNILIFGRNNESRD